MYLFDTNALSEVIRKRPHPGFMRKLAAAKASDQLTSVICVMEMRYGSRRRPDHERFWARLRSQVLSRVGILSLTAREAAIAGDLLARLTSIGRRIGTEDLLIAATAIGAGLTVVTRNVREFRRVPGLRVEDWFASG